LAKYVAGRVIRDNVRSHPAAQAWIGLGPTRAEPGEIHVLKERRKGKAAKSAVFRLTGVGPGASAIVAKRCKASTALVERIIYEEVLPRLPVPRLRFYGYVEEPEGDTCWLFLEDATGEAYSPHVAEHRLATGRWLGRVHTSAPPVDAATTLPDRGPNHYLTHMRSAWGAIHDSFANPALSSDEKDVLIDVISLFEHLDLHWQHLDSLCSNLPSTLVHGDFRAKNIRLRRDSGKIGVLAFDWEEAGWGFPLVDLGQSPSGSTGFSPGPDLEAYWLVVGGKWRDIGREGCEQLAHIGTVFRLLAAISWAAPSLALGWVRRPMMRVRVCGARLSDALRSARWMR
jgi:hypothetical protein